MTDLTDYAKQEAERYMQPYFTGKSNAAPPVAMAEHRGYKRGILRLAEELQREDVLDVAVEAFYTPRTTSAETWSKNLIAAMLAKIAEGTD